MKNLEIIARYRITVTELIDMKLVPAEEKKPIKKSKKKEHGLNKYSNKQRTMVLNKEMPDDELAEILGVERLTIGSYRKLWKKKYPHLIKKKSGQEMMKQLLDKQKVKKQKKKNKEPPLYKLNPLAEENK